MRGRQLPQPPGAVSAGRPAEPEQVMPRAPKTTLIRPLRAGVEVDVTEQTVTISFMLPTEAIGIELGDKSWDALVGEVARLQKEERAALSGIALPEEKKLILPT